MGHGFSLLFLVLVFAGCVGKQAAAPLSTPVFSPTTQAPPGDAAIEVMVTDSEHLPVPEARVQMIPRADPSAAFELVADAEGKARRDGIAPGAYLVSAGKVGYSSSSPRTVELVDDETANVQIVLDPLRAIVPYHETKSYRVQFRTQVCVLTPATTASCTSVYTASNLTVPLEVDELEQGEISTIVVEMQWAASVSTCNPTMLSHVYAPDAENLPSGSAAIARTQSDRASPFFWTNVPDSIRSPTKLYIPREGEDPNAMFSPERTTRNGGQPINTTGAWRTVFWTYPTGALGTPVDFMCTVEQIVTTYVTGFWVEPAAADWSALAR